tara:strand:- start:801 stop:1088 length:288 start_codon:yes stop_codon:yes gene_type:complete
MVFCVEKELVDQDYYELSDIDKYYSNCPDNISHIWAYAKKYDECAMVTLDYDNLYNKWILSYPIKNHRINYRVVFNSENEIKEYMRFILNENSME